MFAKSKTKKFASDKERKQFFAIQGYYKKKEAGNTSRDKKKK